VNEQAFGTQVAEELIYRVQVAKRTMGLTVGQLAAQIGRDRSFLAEIRRQGKVSLSTLLGVLSVLQIQTVDFFACAMHPNPSSPLWKFRRGAALLSEPPGPQILRIEQWFTKTANLNSEAVEVLTSYGGPPQLTLERLPVSRIDDLEQKRHDRPHRVMKTILAEMETFPRSPRPGFKPHKAWTATSLLGVLGSCYGIIGEMDQGYHALALAERISSWYHMRERQANIAVRSFYVLCRRNMPAEALRMIGFARAAFKSLEDQTAVDRCWVETGIAFYQQGRLTESRCAYEQALAVLPKSEARYRLAASHALATIAVRQGRLRDAFRFAQMASSLADATDNYSTGMVLWLKANIARHLEHSETAHEAYALALAALHRIPIPLQEAALTIDWIKLCLCERNLRKAYSLGAGMLAYLGPLANHRIIRNAIEETVCAARTGRLSMEFISAIERELKRGQPARRLPPNTRINHLARSDLEPLWCS